jgi:hypothetical protein
MPSIIAHYRFGQDIIERLNPDIGTVINNYKQEYNIGLQGPDIFYYYKPFKENEIYDFGVKCHSNSATKMFGPMIAQKQENAALSYLLGLICHYTLDRCCHPYIYANSHNISEHLVMESVYDRYVMQCYKIIDSQYKYIEAAGADYWALASLWYNITDMTVKKSIVSMRNYSRLLGHKIILRICETVLKKEGVFDSMVVPKKVNQSYAVHNLALDSLYEAALNEGRRIITETVNTMGTEDVCIKNYILNYEGVRPCEQA